LVALVACIKLGVNRPKQTRVIERKLNFYFSNCDLDFDHIHLGSNLKLRLYVSNPYSKFGVNRLKQTKVIERNLNFYFSNSDLDLDHRLLGSNPNLPLDISYPYSMFGVNRPKQTKVIEGKLKLDTRRPAADFSITMTRLSLKTWLKTNILIGLKV